MFKGRNKGGGRGRTIANVVQKVPLNGLFTDAVWHCNCAPRVPATRFQTKNGGKNHGRWFYTCQKPLPKRCNFFLWDDEAKSREAAAVLSNSRSESIATAPRTPAKPSFAPSHHGLQTPDTATTKRYDSPVGSSPQTPSKSLTVTRANRDTQDTNTTSGTSNEEFYDWPASDDEDVAKIVDNVASIKNMPPPETPRKVAKTESLSSPGKRRFSEVQREIEVTYPTLEVVEDDVFTTPSTTLKEGANPTLGQFMFSPAATSTPGRFKNVLQVGQDSELTMEVLKALQDNQISLSSSLKAELKSICDRHSLSTRGIIKGRDISRAMVNTKNETISELQETIAALQAERETNRAVIRHLRRDMESMKDSTN